MSTLELLIELKQQFVDARRSSQPLVITRTDALVYEAALTRALEAWQTTTNVFMEVIDQTEVHWAAFAEASATRNDTSHMQNQPEGAQLRDGIPLLMQGMGENFQPPGSPVQGNSGHIPKNSDFPPDAGVSQFAQPQYPLYQNSRGIVPYQSDEQMAPVATQPISENQHFPRGIDSSSPQIIQGQRQEEQFQRMDTREEMPYLPPIQTSWPQASDGGVQYGYQYPGSDIQFRTEQMSAYHPPQIIPTVRPGTSHGPRSDALPSVNPQAEPGPSNHTSSNQPIYASAESAYYVPTQQKLTSRSNAPSGVASSSRIGVGSGTSTRDNSTAGVSKAKNGKKKATRPHQYASAAAIQRSAEHHRRDLPLPSSSSSYTVERQEGPGPGVVQSQGNNTVVQGQRKQDTSKGKDKAGS